MSRFGDLESGHRLFRKLFGKRIGMTLSRVVAVSFVVSIVGLAASQGGRGYQTLVQVAQNTAPVSPATNVPSDKNYTPQPQEAPRIGMTNSTIILPTIIGRGGTAVEFDGTHGPIENNHITTGSISGFANGLKVKGTFKENDLTTGPITGPSK